jgi:hypothetical protein
MSSKETNKTLKQLLEEINEIEYCFDPAEEALKRFREWLTQKRQGYEMPEGSNPSYDVIVILSVFDELLEELK